ncbi:hypothetical protein C8J57DRAFT_1245909 [Mycena rebaudengoi]|nr:hypothetical protein C8J57DRAFT_1245909 [Mycena rebaudengoi]
MRCGNPILSRLVYGKGRGLTVVVRVQVWWVRVRVGLGPKPYNPEPAPYRHQFYRGSKPAVKARFGVLIIDTSHHTGQVVVGHECFGGAAKKKEGKTEKGTSAEDGGELKLEQAIMIWFGCLFGQGIGQISAHQWRSTTYKAFTIIPESRPQYLGYILRFGAPGVLTTHHGTKAVKLYLPSNRLELRIGWDYGVAAAPMWPEVPGKN